MSTKQKESTKLRGLIRIGVFRPYGLPWAGLSAVRWAFSRLSCWPCPAYFLSLGH